MIDVFSWPTPNGHKVHIMLEECCISYTLHPIDIERGDQFGADFLKISPNNKIPAIFDPQGLDGRSIDLFESGAILMYLAQKSGRFLPTDPLEHYATLQWLMFQMGDVGPMFGQVGHFSKQASQKIPYAIERYTKEMHRLCRVMDERLKISTYIAHEAYSIADIALFPWVRALTMFDVNWGFYPNLKRWLDLIAARPAVQKGLKVFESL